MTATPPVLPAALNEDTVESNIADIARLLERDMADTVPLTPCATLTASGVQDWLAGVRGKRTPLRHPRIALFAAGAPARLERLHNGKDPLCALSEDINCDLQVYELPAGTGSDRAAQLHALTYGMMAVQPGLDALALSGLDDTAVPAFAGFDDMLASPRADIAAAMGAVIAARLARVPVFAAGAMMSGVAALLERIRIGNAAHVLDVTPLLGHLAGEDSAVNCALALGQAKSLAALASVR